MPDDHPHIKLARGTGMRHRPHLFHWVDEVYLRLVEGKNDLTDNETEKFWNLAKDIVGDYMLNHMGRDWHSDLQHI